jgi:hypothetical protein
MRTILLSALALALPLSGTAIEEVRVPFGQREVLFRVVRSPIQERGPVLLSLHSNESTSLSAAQQLIGKFAGTIIAIDGGGSRRIPLHPNSNRVTLDPNRAFSAAGVKRDLNRFSIFTDADAAACVQFGEAIVSTFRIGQGLPVIALHNNTNGGYSIRSYEKGGNEAKAAAKVFKGKADPDDFFLVTHPQLFEELKAAGYNVVLQDNRNAPDDGSLSVFCGRNGIVYANVETEHGKLDTQREMLEALLRILKN